MNKEVSYLDETRSRILTQAGQRFRAHGFARVSIGELCAEMRIAKKTFYKYFHSKELLVHALVEDHAQRYLPEALRVMNSLSDAPVEDRVQESLRLFFTYSAEHFSGVFLNDIRVMLPDLWTHMNRRRQGLVQAFAALVAAGQKDGTYRTDVDSARLAKVLSLILDSVLDPQTLYQHGLPPHEVAPMLFDLIHSGLKSREPEPQRRCAKESTP